MYHIYSSSIFVLSAHFPLVFYLLVVHLKRLNLRVKRTFYLMFIAQLTFYLMFKTPKKSFDHPCHLKSRVPPLGLIASLSQSSDPTEYAGSSYRVY